MASGPIGEAFVQIRPSFATFSAELEAGVSSAVEAASAAVETSFGSLVSEASVSAEAIGTAFDEAGVAIASGIEAGAAAAGAALAGIGGATGAVSIAGLSEIPAEAAAAGEALVADLSSAVAESSAILDRLPTEAGLVFEQIAAAMADLPGEADASFGGVSAAAEESLSLLPAEARVSAEAMAAAIEEASAGVESALAAIGAGATNTFTEMAVEAKTAFGSVAESAATATAASDGFLGSITGAATGVKGIVAALGVGFGLKLAGDLQQTQVAFTGLFQSANIANDFIVKLQNFVAHTPFRFGDITQASQQLLALGHSGQQTIDILGDIGNAAAAVGASGDSFQRVVQALTLIESRGKLSARELRAIQTALPNVTQVAIFDNIAEATGKSTDALHKLADAGQITSEVAIPAIIKALKEVPGAEGALERQSKTLLGVLSTLKDDLIFAAQRGFAPLAKSIAETISAPGALEDFQKTLQAVLVPVGAGLSDIFKGATQGFAALGPSLAPAAEAFGNLLSAVAPLGEVIGQTVSLAVQSITPLIQALTSVVAPITAVSHALALLSNNTAAKTVIEGVVAALVTLKAANAVGEVIQLTAAFSRAALAAPALSAANTAVTETEATLAEGATIAADASATLASTLKFLEESTVELSGAEGTLILTTEEVDAALAVLNDEVVPLAAGQAEAAIATGAAADALAAEAAAAVEGATTLAEFAAAAEAATAADAALAESATAASLAETSQAAAGGAGVLGNLAGGAAGAAGGLAEIAGPAAIAAAAVAGIGVGLTALSKSLAGTAPDVQDMTAALLTLGATREIGGALFDTFGGDLSKLGPQIKTVTDNTGGLFDQFKKGQELGGGDIFGGIGNVLGNIFSPSVRKARQDVDSLDNALAGIVKGGNAQESIQLAKQLGLEIDATGAVVGKGAKAFDDYNAALKTDALAKQAAEQAKLAPTVDNVTKAVAAGKLTFAQSLIDKVRGTALEADLTNAYNNATVALAQQKREAAEDKDKMDALGLGTEDATAKEQTFAQSVQAAIAAEQSKRDTELANTQATKDVTAARKAYNLLISEGVNKNPEVVAAQKALTDATKQYTTAQQQALAAKKALDDLLKPATARSLADATDAVTQAQINQSRGQLSAADAAQKLTEAQKALAKAQADLVAARAAGANQATLDKLNLAVTSSTEGLTSAQLDVKQSTIDAHGSTEALADAQQKLNDLQHKSTLETPEVVAARKAVADAEDTVSGAFDKQVEAKAKADAAIAAVPAAQQKALDALNVALDRSAKASDAAKKAAHDAGTEQDFLTGKITESDQKYLNLKTDIENANIPQVVKDQLNKSLQDLLPDLSLETLKTLLGITTATSLQQLIAIIEKNPNLTGQQIFDLVGAEGAILDRPTRLLAGEAGREVLAPLTRPKRAARLVEESGLLGIIKPHLSTAALEELIGPGATVSLPTATRSVGFDSDQLARAIRRELAPLLEELGSTNVSVTSVVQDPTVLAAKIANRIARRARR